MRPPWARRLLLLLCAWLLSALPAAWSVLPGESLTDRFSGVVYYKFHKTGGTTASYTIFQGLQRAADATGARLEVAGKSSFSHLGAWCTQHQCGDAAPYRSSPSPGGGAAADSHSSSSSSAGRPPTICLFNQHPDLRLLEGDPPNAQLASCYGPLSSPSLFLTTTVREPAAKQISWYFYSCHGPGSPLPSVEEFVELYPRQAARCGLDNEFSSHAPWVRDGMSVEDVAQLMRGYGLRVGMLSSPDDYFVLVAMSLGIDVEYFSHYLPVMVKGPPEGVDERTYHDYRTRLAEDPRVIDMMNRHVSHKERLFFEAAQLVAAEWLASFNQTQLHQQKKRFAKERTRFLNSLGILHEGNRAFLDCKDAELVASLPKLDWRRSMLGGRGRGRGFKYCV
mmetsp:Transcript_3542/g.12738  ORF Transcript_3542/g.12738 Transcript_3542/m.12738 type:complete len:393 (+) Transcript_3542:423-1601(+)